MIKDSPCYIGLNKEEAKLLAKLLPAAPDGEPTRFVDFSAPIRDAEGRLRLYVGHGQDAEFFAHDIRELLRKR